MSTFDRIFAVLGALWASILLAAYSVTGEPWQLGLGIFTALMFFGAVIRP